MSDGIYSRMKAYTIHSNMLDSYVFVHATAFYIELYFLYFSLMDCIPEISMEFRMCFLMEANILNDI